MCACVHACSCLQSKSLRRLSADDSSRAAVEHPLIRPTHPLPSSAPLIRSRIRDEGILSLSHSPPLTHTLSLTHSRFSSHLCVVGDGCGPEQLVSRAKQRVERRQALPNREHVPPLAHFLRSIARLAGRRCPVVPAGQASPCSLETSPTGLTLVSLLTSHSLLPLRLFSLLVTRTATAGRTAALE